VWCGAGGVAHWSMIHPNYRRRGLFFPTRRFFDATMAASSAEAKSSAAAPGTKLFAVEKPTTGALTASLSGGGDGSPKLKKKLLLKKKGFGAKKPKKAGLGAVKKKKVGGTSTNFDEVEAKVKVGRPPFHVAFYTSFFSHICTIVGGDVSWVAKELARLWGPNNAGQSGFKWRALC
jgi:hypothetical protein